MFGLWFHQLDLLAKEMKLVLVDVVLVCCLPTKDGNKGMGNPAEMYGTQITRPGDSLTRLLSVFRNGPAERLNLTWLVWRDGNTAKIPIKDEASWDVFRLSPGSNTEWFWIKSDHIAFKQTNLDPTIEWPSSCFKCIDMFRFYCNAVPKLKPIGYCFSVLDQHV